MYVFLFSSATLACRDESQKDGALQILLEYSKQTQNNFPEDHGLKGKNNILFFNCNFGGNKKVYTKPLRFRSYTKSHTKNVIYCFMSNIQKKQDEGPVVLQQVIQLSQTNLAKSKCVIKITVLFWDYFRIVFTL